MSVKTRPLLYLLAAQAALLSAREVLGATARVTSDDMNAGSEVEGTVLGAASFFQGLAFLLPLHVSL